MKKSLSFLPISLLLLFIAGCITVQRPAPATPVETNKESEAATQPASQNATIKYFTSVKVGNPSQPSGLNELLVVENTFRDLKATRVIPTGTKKERDAISVSENLDINANTRNFGHISENYEAWIQPGQILKAMSVISGKPTAIVEPRNPMVLTVSLKNVSKTNYTVQNPEKNVQLQEAGRNLITQNGNPSVAHSFSFHKIHSVEEMEFALTGKYRGALSSFARSFGLNTGNKQQYHFYMLEYRQKMFDIQAEGITPANVFKQAVTDMSDYVYIDKVNYGQKGIIIFKSPRTLEEMGINAGANYATGLSEKNISAVCKELSGNKEVQLFARFYGGASPTALKAMENNVKKQGQDVIAYIKSQPANHRQALPVSYTLKNLNNEVVGLKSNKRQTVTTTTKASPSVPSVYKLKVTLTDIQCYYARDGRGESDDYGIQQYIVYKALGKDKKYVNRAINKFPNKIDQVGQVPGIKNPLIMGDVKNQIHAKENDDINFRDRNMINNSLVFHVTPNELKDPNASFKVFTWLKEYSTTFFGGNDDKVLMNNTSVNVKINDVINILLGKKSLNENTRIPAEDVGRLFKFHNFGAGNMFLANIQKIQPLVLEGPIYYVNPDVIVAVWIQFELID
ncbi:MAG: hypothetical protein ABI290_05220 [Ginsengibacter sp.]